MKGTPPHLDVFLKGSGYIWGIESKLTEILDTRPPKFSCSYYTKSKDAWCNSKYFEEMQRLRKVPKDYSKLDAAQLIKHAFGLLNSCKDDDVTLLYLYWEPSNHNNYCEFAEHRDELRRFTDRVSDAKPRFVSMSYYELWCSWADQSQSGWLESHLANLRARYQISI